VGETRDDVYRFMRDKVSPTEAPARLVVARWCMFNGLREQALTEARAILQFQPQNKSAVDLARSLEESIKKFPPEGSTAAIALESAKALSVAEADLEITPEGATTFATRVQPILANLCVDCHARPDYAGTFKLLRVTGFEAGPQSSQANLRATVGQLLKSDPANSPLLTKAVLAHGGLKLPPFVSRQLPGFRILESWVILAVGPASPSSGGMGPNAQPLAQQGQPMPPVVSVPVAPSLPAVPAVVAVPPVLPTPAVLPPTVPSQPPIIPPADAIPKIPAPPITPIPPAVSIPPVPGNVRPVSGPPTGSQFGAGAPPKPASGTVPGDEFDPSIFNQGTRGK
jgi:hypothetical protein